MLILSIDHIQLTAPRNSEDKVRAFYGEILGLAEIPKPTNLQARGGVWFNAGNVPLHIGVEDHPANTASRRHVALRVENLDAVRAVLSERDIEIEEDTAPLEAARRFFCRDSVGNRVEFIEWQAVRSSDSAEAAPPAHTWLNHPEALEQYSVAAGSVERVAVSADGVWLAAGSAVEDERGGAKPGISLWRASQAGTPEVEIELSASTWELAFSPNGRELACLSEDGSLETWRADSGEFENDQFVELSTGSNGLAYSENGGLLAVGARDSVEVYRPGLAPFHTVQPGLGKIKAVAFDPNDTLAVSGEALRIQLWQLRPVQRSSWELLGHASPVVFMRFNPTHPLLAAATEHGQVLLWDVNDGPEAPRTLGGEMGGVEALAFSPDGSALACGDDGGAVWLWDWQAETVLARIEMGSPITSLAFSPDGAQLSVGGEDGRVKVWKVK